MSVAVSLTSDAAGGQSSSPAHEYPRSTPGDLPIGVPSGSTRRCTSIKKAARVWRTASDAPGGRYWDRTGDLLGVGKGHRKDDLPNSSHLTQPSRARKNRPVYGL